MEKAQLSHRPVQLAAQLPPSPARPSSRPSYPPSPPRPSSPRPQPVAAHLARALPTRPTRHAPLPVHQARRRAPAQAARPNRPSSRSLSQLRAQPSSQALVRPQPSARMPLAQRRRSFAQPPPHLTASLAWTPLLLCMLGPLVICFLFKKTDSTRSGSYSFVRAQETETATKISPNALLSPSSGHPRSASTPASSRPSPRSRRPGVQPARPATSSQRGSPARPAQRAGLTRLASVDASPTRPRARPIIAWRSCAASPSARQPCPTMHGCRHQEERRGEHAHHLRRASKPRHHRARRRLRPLAIEEGATPRSPYGSLSRR
jgi:hypothetical protein